jgi:hypothetical protein
MRSRKCTVTHAQPTSTGGWYNQPQLLHLFNTLFPHSVLVMFYSLYSLTLARLRHCIIIDADGATYSVDVDEIPN